MAHALRRRRTKGSRMTLQAFLLNRVWVVIDNDTHQQIGEPFPTKMEADRFILEQWKDTKPKTDISERITFDDANDLTESILGIIERIHGPDSLWIAGKAA